MIDLKWISLNKFSVILLGIFTALPGVGVEHVNEKGEFLNSRAEALVNYQLKKFGSECTFIGSSEAKNIEKMEKIVDKYQPTMTPSQKTCYSDLLPKMKSVSYLYRRLCDSLSYKGIPKERQKMLNQFVAVRKYQDGVSLQHVVLNDCLINVNADNSIIVPSSSAESETGLIKKLDKMKTTLPFKTNRVELR